MGLFRNWLSKFATNKAVAERDRMIAEFKKLRSSHDRLLKLLEHEKNAVIAIRVEKKSEVDLLKTEIDSLNVELSKCRGDIEFYKDNRDEEILQFQRQSWDDSKKIQILENEIEVLKSHIRNLQSVIEREFERTTKEAAVLMRQKQSAIDGRVQPSPFESML